MNRGRVGEERGSKEMDGCPLTRTAQKDQLHISIQKENTRMQDVKHDGSDQINRLGPVHVPDGY
jgi:hypothetical protein